MSPLTHPVFFDDPYQQSCDANVVQLTDFGGVILDRTNFYATSGGQPGDKGTLVMDDGTTLEIVNTIKDKQLVGGNPSGGLVLIPVDGGPMPAIGQGVTCELDWERRYRLMRMHAACHILSVVCPYPITSANVGELESRVDFDMPALPGTKQDITAAMMDIISRDHVIFDQWIDEAELESNPGLVKSKNVRPPRGVGKIRLVCIGDDSSVDSQPCGGTHVMSTMEIGDVHIGKIEKKGKENRRFRIRFGQMPG